jgi:aspartyl-tRNA(Asn)/glutamyl-tRNA(Gln) amidotransferase subunit B
MAEELEGLHVQPIIGLEIHVQLATRTKLFCGCKVATDAAPNTHICPVCAGHPGTLPVLNQEALAQALRACLALNCAVPSVTHWDRKSYFYPDLPKGYQISQYDQPLGRKGSFDFECPDGEVRTIALRRAHLEEDAGKSLHDDHLGTLVDLNRAGAPLLEVVTEPHFSSADEVHAFCIAFHHLVTYLEISEGVMQRGQMRFEPNVNVRIADATAGCAGAEMTPPNDNTTPRNDGATTVNSIATPIVEIKNLNSFKAVRAAIEFEIARQTRAWQADPHYLRDEMPNENRGWDPDLGETVLQRRKEAAHDYRYFPDPDLLPLRLAPAWLDELRRSLPELPLQRARRFVQHYDLPRKTARQLTTDRATGDLFESTVAASVGSGEPAPTLSDDPQAAASTAHPASTVRTIATQLIHIWSKLAQDRRMSLGQLPVAPAHIARLAAMTEEALINRSAAAVLAEGLLERSINAEPASSRPSGAADNAASPASPEVASANRSDSAHVEAAFVDALAAELGLLQTRDTDQTQAWVDEALQAHPQAVQDATQSQAKRQAARGFLLGRVMSLAAGRADPHLARELLEVELDRLTSEGNPNLTVDSDPQ